MTMENTGALQPIAWIKQQLGPGCQEVPVQGGQPLVLDDWRYGYVTLSEHHEIFCVGYRNGQPAGRREHLVRCPPGQLLLGVSPGESSSARVLLLSGVAGSVVWRVSVAALAQAVRLLPNGPRQIGRLLDSWMSLLIDTLPRPALPADCRAVAEGEKVVGAVGRLRAAAGLCWISPSTSPTSYQGIAVETVAVPVPLWPLRPDTVAMCSEGEVEVLSTSELLAADPSGSFARPFASFVVTEVGNRLTEAAHRRFERDLASNRAESDFLDASLGTLAKVGRAERVTRATLAQGEDLGRAVTVIHEAMKLDAPKVDAPRGSTVADVGAALERSSGARSRPVLLEGEWWRGPGGPLLGFLGDGPDGDGDPGAADPSALRPVALLPGESVYRMFDPQASSGRAVRLNAVSAQQIHPQAFQFYRRLPPGGGKFNLARFLARGSGRDGLLVFAVGLVVGGLGLLIPLVTGLIFDRVVPGAERGLLAQLVLVILAAYLGTALFDLAQGFALLRLQTRMDLEAESAIWDHLLRLPLRFFRRFTAGELAARVAGIASIREAVAGATLTSLLGGVFSIWYLGLMLTLDLSLALAALVLVAVAALLAVLVSAFQLLASRRLAALDGRLSGLLFQLVSGIAKLRVARAERRGFGVWATLVSKRRSEEVGLQHVGNRYALFQVIYPTLCTAVVFYLLTNPSVVPGAAPSTPMSTGTFLSFFTAFGSLMSAALGMLGAVLRVVAVIPLYERAKPVLDESPEDAGAGTGMVQLSGQMELSHLSFRYHPDAPLVLDDISLRIEPGEFVAVVGASGSGKSTLLRLLLGLESPSSGFVYYDGQALSSLDVRAVRQQLGVVLQATDIMAGSIYTNIAGSSGATLDQAWHAARLAAFDKDIQEMPMGMHTLLTQGRSSLSGGQQQRLLIARALVRKPRILLLDEATSALDNQSQAAVIHSLQGLAVTRLVIAHRLSTIQNADRILVLQRGRVVEEGTFAKLMSQQGPFRALADRQLT
jgi:NHLM bacteriocin system ABC transporter ATP-binding protein